MITTYKGIEYDTVYFLPIEEPEFPHESPGELGFGPWANESDEGAFALVLAVLEENNPGIEFVREYREGEHYVHPVTEES